MHLLLISPTPDDDTIIAEISTYKMKCVTINSLVATTLKTSIQNGTEYAVISCYYLTFQAEVFIFLKKHFLTRVLLPPLTGFIISWCHDVTLPTGRPEWKLCPYFPFAGRTPPSFNSLKKI